MKLSPVEQRIKEIIEPAIDDLGFRLVTLKLEGDGHSQRLVIMAENPNTGLLGVDECAAISRSLSTLLDVEDPIKNAYRLEVSSPGVDRPLVSPEDFIKNKDMLIKLETLTAINNQRRFKGKIESFSQDTHVLTLNIDNVSVDIDADNIKKANLVITEELLKKGAEQRAQALQS